MERAVSLSVGEKCTEQIIDFRLIMLSDYGVKNLEHGGAAI